MTQVARIKTRGGEIRLCALAPHNDLPSWWLEMKSTGHVLGQKWGIPFKEIVLVDLVEIDVDIVAPDIRKRDNAMPDAVIGLEHAIASGAWKPPGDAH
jgi:hypothetical protein